MQIVLLLLGIGLGHITATMDVTASFDSSQTSYNVGEDVVVVCHVSSDSQVSLGFTTQWHKKQHGEFLMVGRDENVMSEPFESFPKRYSVDFKYSRETYVTKSHLRIKGIRVEDTGMYKCLVGYTKEGSTTEGTFTESNKVSLVVNPERGLLSLSTSATSKEGDGGGKLEFNEGKMVMCTGSANSTSSNLGLSIQLASGLEITNDFVQTSSVKWHGPTGFQVPTTRHTLTANSWLPDKSGDGTLTCFYRDGEPTLAMQQIVYTQDADTSVNCTSNLERPARLDHLDIYITCKVYKYDEDLGNLAAKWSFRYANETITLKTGKTQHFRTAKQTGGDYVLYISRITREMVQYGKYFPYSVSIYRKDNDKTIATTHFDLPLDTTLRITSNDAPHSYISPLLLIQSLMVLRLLI